MALYELLYELLAWQINAFMERNKFRALFNQLLLLQMCVISPQGKGKQIDKLIEPDEGQVCVKQPPLKYNFTEAF